MERASSVTWVPSHGEPHHAHQLRTADGLVLPDGEAPRRAPAEHDYLDIADELRVHLGARDWAIELFELEWRLTEIAEDVDWFRRPHTGSADDEAAWTGLQEDLKSHEEAMRSQASDSESRYSRRGGGTPSQRLEQGGQRMSFADDAKNKANELKDKAKEAGAKLEQDAANARDAVSEAADKAKTSVQDGVNSAKDKLSGN